MKRIGSLLLALLFLLSLTACAAQPFPQPQPSESTSQTVPGITVEEDGQYDTKDEVALYIHLFGKLPDNYMTKSDARQHGWKSGPLCKILPGMCIGGDIFQNRENRLPKKSGRIYYECDIGTLSSNSRGAKRIVYSSDGLVYYTSDHYDSFTLLYGEP